MEMRIVVPGAGSVSALADQLVSSFGSDCVALLGDRPEVAVRVAGESDRTVLGVLDTVERWLDQAGLPAAEMCGRELVPARTIGSARGVAMTLALAQIRSRKTNEWRDHVPAIEV